MIRQPVVALVAVLTALMSAGSARACTCKPWTPLEYARWVQILIEGDVVSARTEADRQTTLIRVRRVIKGGAKLRRRQGDVIQVVTLLSAAACGYRFPTSGRSLVALRARGGRYWTGLCTMLPLRSLRVAAYVAAVRASAKK